MDDLKTIAFIDIEVNKKGAICDIGGIAGRATFHDHSISAFGEFLQGCQYVCGHNIINHDLQYLDLGERYFIDTLYLSPLLFPQKPYHYLLKDDKWLRTELNNPLNDSEKAMDLFNAEIAKFERLEENLKLIYYSLLQNNKFFKYFFDYLDFSQNVENLPQFIKNAFLGKICENVDLDDIIYTTPIELAYAIAQIDVMLIDSGSITPPWVLRTFPKVENVIHRLKGISCGSCEYCQHSLNIHAALQKWFHYNDFRTYDGEPLQEMATQKAIDGKSILAVFPTGGGKSITFQLPALMLGENEKGLTVVISPLQSLQKDQVDNLEYEHNITKAVRLDGSLDPVERAKYIEYVEDGGASLLYISPESLRSKSMARLLTQRNIVRFVIDEAHCFSAWGQDFRTDYLYIAEFIKNLQESKGNNKIIPVSCFTATAKQEVITDIMAYFADNLNIELESVISTSARTNLSYHAIRVHDDAEKKQKLRDYLMEHNCPSIVYVSRTYRATELAKECTEYGLQALAYHGKMDKKERIANQEAFIQGRCDIIVATKAFGMGVDKKDVGLVIHYDISTSLEDYVQEAGRAGRDENLAATCYALFNDEDINKHFSFLNQTKITQAEINRIWRAIKEIYKKTRKTDEIMVSVMDIAREASWSDENVSEVATRVTTSINALEQAHFLKRGQNMPKVYANSILVQSTAEASAKITQSALFGNDKEKEEARRVVARLFKTRAKGGRDDTEDNNEHIDYIADREQLDIEKVHRIVQTLKEEGILADAKDLYGFLQKDSGAHANSNLNIHQDVEFFLCDFLQEHEDMINIGQKFNIKDINMQLQARYPKATVKNLNQILNFYDIKRLVKKLKDEHKDYILLKPYLEINEIREKSEKRLLIARYIIEYLYNKMPKVSANAQPASLKDNTSKVEFSVLSLQDSFNQKFAGWAQENHASAEEIEDALYYLKRINALAIDGGFLVIYNRMSINHLENTNKKYTQEHYKKLDNYYENKKEQIHIVGEYLKLLSQDYDKALEFTHDYFVMNYAMFKQKYFRGRLGELQLNMTQARYNQLFKDLSAKQREIINDKHRFIAVIAGPGSGKTMLLTHKLAAIYMQENIKHEQILMLTFSRVAATEFKKRLLKLIGGAANFVKIRTFHSYCFDLLGKVGSLEKSDMIVEDTINAIESGNIDGLKLANEIIVVDEAQDMSEAEYRLIKTLIKHNNGARVIMVGDDDQNIYEWRGSSSEYLGNLANSEKAAKYELIENFRSAANIVEFTNNFAKKIKNRLKTQDLVSVAHSNNGNISITKLVSNNIEIPITNAVLKEHPSGSVCIVVRTNEQANNILGLLNHEGINAKIIQSNSDFSLLDLVEVRYFLAQVETGTSATISSETWNEAKAALNKEYATSADLDHMLRLIKDFEATNTKAKYKATLRHLIAESKLEDFMATDKPMVFISTIHQTKGREFDNVYLALDYKKLDDPERRAIYVAMTRAKSKLHIQYIGSYLDDIDVAGLIKQQDTTNYGKPARIVLSLTHKDVVLSFFEKVQNQINTLRSGQSLEANEQGCFAGGRQVLRFSQKFAASIAQQKSRGYGIHKATISHIVYWYPKDKPIEETKESKIILTDIEFIQFSQQQ